MQEDENPRIPNNCYMKVARLSALGIGRLYLQELPVVFIFWRRGRIQCHGATGRIRAMKNHNVSIGNWTREFRTCSSVPQRTVLPRSSLTVKDLSYLNKGWPTRWHLLYYILFNMFQTLIRPSSGASEYLLCCVGWLEAYWYYVTCT